MTGGWYEGPATTFDTVADLYELARPRYPSELFDDVAALTGLGRGPARVLEIGAGTGQATRGLLARGWGVVALEPGSELARVARRVLARQGDLDVVIATFEEWPGGDASFDLVLAATSWHWLDATVAYQKAAALLRPGGHLAIVATEHVLPVAGGDAFFREVEEAYDAVGLGDGRGGPRPPEAVPAPDVAAIEACGLFGPVVERRYVWHRTYSAGQYLALLATYSNHIEATPQQRERLFAEVRRRIESRPGASVRKHYLTILQLAAVRASGARSGWTASRPR